MQYLAYSVSYIGQCSYGTKFLMLKVIDEYNVMSVGLLMHVG